MTEQQFAALKDWIRKVAVHEIAERTFKNPRGVDAVAEKMVKAERLARALLVKET